MFTHIKIEGAYDPSDTISHKIECLKDGDKGIYIPDDLMPSV